MLGIHGTNVKLGFDLDAAVPVHRSEVWERINASGQADSGQASSQADSLTEGPVELPRDQE